MDICRRQALNGKEAVRQWMVTEYVEPPLNIVANLIAEGDFVTALGDLTLKDKDGRALLVLRCLALSRRQDGRIKSIHRSQG